MKLFVVLLGGRIDGCTIELHDVTFIVGDSLEEMYPSLVNKWFGNKERLHIDSSIELNYVDHHGITLNKTKPESHEKKLFFVNFGGYKADFFGELHDINFYVAATKADAIAKAKKELCVGLLQQHCDDNLIIDDILELEQVGGYYIHLNYIDNPSPLKINSGYIKLSRPEILEKAPLLETEASL